MNISTAPVKRILAGPGKVSGPITLGGPILLGIIMLFIVACSSEPETAPEAVNFAGWTAAEMASIQSLWLGSLPPLPPDPSNAADDDPRAAAFGQKLFFDARFSANGQVY